MQSYRQYCPVAKASEILGDRWTVLIVRELIGGMENFNAIARGLPGIPRSVLSDRLRRLEKCGVLNRVPLKVRATSPSPGGTGGGDSLPDLSGGAPSWLAQAASARRPTATQGSEGRCADTRTLYGPAAGSNSIRPMPDSRS